MGLRGALYVADVRGRRQLRTSPDLSAICLSFPAGLAIDFGPTPAFAAPAGRHCNRPLQQVLAAKAEI
jgi:hypothetical protein